MFRIFEERILVPLKGYLDAKLSTQKKLPLLAFGKYLFDTSFLPNNEVSRFHHKVDGRAMTSLRVPVLKSSKSSKAVKKKLILHVPGSAEDTYTFIPKAEPLMRQINEENKKAGFEVEVACICQDYRGRGLNSQTPLTNDEDKLSEGYSVDQDARDLAVLIEKLCSVYKYSPEDIILHTHGYGSQVALKAIHDLCRGDKTKGLGYGGMNVFSDVGYGNLLDFPLLKTLFCDKEKPAPVPKPEFPPEVYETLHFSTLSGLNTGHLLRAMVLEAPIKLHFPFNFPRLDKGECIIGYAMKTGAAPDTDDFMPLAQSVYAEAGSKPEAAAVNIESTRISELLLKLHKYCQERAKLSSEVGRNFKRGVPGYRWSVGEQLTGATHLMACLTRKPEPDCNEILKMDLKGRDEAAYASGELKEILQECAKFAEEYQRLQRFNEILAEARYRRSERKQTPLFFAKSINLDDEIYKLTPASLEPRRLSCNG